MRNYKTDWLNLVLDPRGLKQVLKTSSQSGLAGHGVIPGVDPVETSQAMPTTPALLEEIYEGEEHA